MNQVTIVYWSGTGNTENMANMLAEGAKSAGSDVQIQSVDVANADELAQLEGFALGCPSMGAEELEESEMEPFVTSLEGKVNGKKIVLFGSYGWGDGQWMRDWEQRMQQAGAEIVGGEGIISNDAPDDETEQKLREAGEKLAQI
ncbi:MAG: flavodoxin [Hespellia sp.]|nr:flavodoxin [Hespellia sp.]